MSVGSRPLVVHLCAQACQNGSSAVSLINLGLVLHFSCYIDVLFGWRSLWWTIQVALGIADLILHVCSRVGRYCMPLYLVFELSCTCVCLHTACAFAVVVWTFFRFTIYIHSSLCVCAFVCLYECMDACIWLHVSSRVVKTARRLFVCGSVTRAGILRQVSFNFNTVCQSVDAACMPRPIPRGSFQHMVAFGSVLIVTSCRSTW